ncbi:MAG TPA: Flp pilus assembly protein CpaB [Thermoleophilaceae bacterium]|nr:Flp pilus assembly protein CpaB [Thermoleophilaceae bacterium]
MSARTRRRRGLVLLALATACGGLAASAVGDRVAEIEQRVGAAVPVVVAAHDLEPGTELTGADLAVRQVPHRFAPPDAPAAPRQALGLRTAGPVAAGSPITAGVVGGEESTGAVGGLRRGERALEVAVTAAAAFMEVAAPGVRVDVLVSTDGGNGPARTFVALEDVELLALRPGRGYGGGALDAGGADAGAPGSTAFATLRVTLGQAVYLTAAETFTQELRLLPRPPGDKRRLGRATVDAGAL